MSEGPCSHVQEAAAVVEPHANGCEKCLEMGDSWVHLRLCMTCGHVGCCNDSKNKHATAHFKSEGHPVMRSFEPGENWWYCFVDDEGYDIKDSPPAPSYS